MVEWTMTGGGKSTQTGLSPGQTSGYVGETYVVRPAAVPETEVYKPGIGSTSIMIEPTGEATTVKRDVYGNVISVKQTSSTGETVFQRVATPRGGSVEAGLPLSLQPKYAEIEQTRAEIPMYRAMAAPIASPQAIVVPTPMQLGFVGQGQIFKAFEERRQQQLYPSTPIDYSKTHISELYSYPLYKWAAFVSRGLQAGYERVIDVLPEPEPIKEAQKGFGSLFTGIPEFMASGVSGWEYAAREPEIFKTDIVPAAKMFGAGLAEQATTRPFYTLGQAAGIGVMLKGSPRFSGIERLRLTSGKPSPENVFFPERPGRLAKTPSLLTKPITEMLRFPERERLPQRPMGTEGLELFKIPKRQEISKPVVLEGVKTISTIPESYRLALEKGAGPFAERGVMGIRFGSKGYRPTGVAKPENIFRTGEFKKFLKEEKAISYVPTFERLKAEPQIKLRVQVMTAEKTYVLPSLRNLQVIKTAPKTSLRIATLPKVSIRTATMTDLLIQTRPKTYTHTMTRTATMTALSTKSLTKTMIMPSTMTRLSIMPDIQIKTALKPLTRQQIKTRTQISTRTQTKTMFDVGVMKLTKPKTKSIDIFPSKRGRKGKKSAFKFPELAKVATPKQIMRGFKL